MFIMKETDELKKELNDFVENVLLKRLASGAIAVIRKRTQKGRFLEGSCQYSTKPFAMPLGGLTKQLRSRIMQESKKHAGRFNLFTSKAGKLWVIVSGGYRKIRELAGKDTTNVSLSWTGRMMGNLGVLPAAGAGSAEIGFKSREQEQKALYHNILGAGKSKKKHVFLYLTDKELDKIVKEALN